MVRPFQPVSGVERPLGWNARRTGSAKPDILILGDSMTAGFGIADDDLYSTVLSRHLRRDVTAYGGGGYGTLQESLLLDQVSPSPRLTVLQVTSNDFINNSWKLESRSWTNSNLRVRPYLEDGRVVYRLPFRSPMVEPLVTHSRLALFLMFQISRVGAHLAAGGKIHSVEHDIARRGLNYPPFRTAVDTTERLVAAMRDRTRLVVFAADDPQQPYLETWRQVCTHQGIPFFDGVPKAIVEEERRLGASLRPDGAHWDARGHRIVGLVLAQWLADHHSK